MEVKIKEVETAEIEIECQISEKDFSERYQQTLLQFAKKSKVRGFRKGKVPENIIEKEVGTETILYETANLMIAESYAKIISEKNLEIIGKPEIEILKIAKNNSFKFKIKTFLIPEIQLPDYKKLALAIKNNKKDLVEQEIKEETKEALLFLQKSKAIHMIKNGPAEKGDWVEITFSSPSINNNKQEKQEFILGQGQLIPGFEKEIEGMKVEEEKIFSLSFPHHHFEKNLANKKVTFKLKVEKICFLELPKIDDEFAKKIANFKKLTELEEEIKQRIIKAKKQLIFENQKADLLKNIIQNAIINIPPKIIKQEKERFIENFKTKIKDQFKINLEEYLKQIKKTEAEFEESCQKETELILKKNFILHKIIAKEQIKITDSEVEQRMAMIKSNPENDSQLNNQDKNEIESLKSQIKIILLEEKVFQLLLN